jgi:YD repeat-containing protein
LPLGECGGGGCFNYVQRFRPLHLLYSTSATAAGELQWPSCTTNPGDLMHKLYSYSGGDEQRAANCINNDRSQNFHYDSLDRINWASTDGTQDGWSEQYTIDPWGNLTNIGPYNSNAGYESMNEAPANGQNQLNFGPGFYDAAGNQIASRDAFGALHNYAYDGENHLQSVDASGATTAVAYAYDGDGDRTTKVVGADGTLYWRGPDGNTLAETDLITGNITAEYIFFDGKRIARVDNPVPTQQKPTPTLEFYFSDHLGSTSMVTDSTMQSVREDTDYFPFGGIANEYAGQDSNHYRNPRNPEIRDRRKDSG